MLLFLLLAFTLVPAFRPQPPPRATTAQIRGSFQHAPAGDSAQLEYGNRYGPQKALKARVSKDGDFVFHVQDLELGTPATLSYAGQSATLYLTPGDKLHVSLDFPRFDETLRYRGRGAAANNYLARSLWQFEYSAAGTALRPQDQQAVATTPTQFRQLADSFRAQRHAFLASYASAHALTPAFRRAAADHIDLHWALALLTYPADHQRLTTKSVSLPDTYYAFLRELSPQTLELSSATLDRGITDNTLLQSVLYTYGDHLVPEAGLSTAPTVGEQLYAQATVDLGKTAARDYALFLLLRKQLPMNLAGVLAAYPTFRAYNQDSTLARDLRESIQGQRHVQPGMLAPPFSLVDHTGRQVSLSDFRGKVVYLDFWGTWCAPCLAEMPASATLRQHFANRDVVFVYISVGDTESKWQQMLTTKQLIDSNSVHLRATDQAIASNYRVGGYPAYYVIGRDGRFLSIRPPRPTEEAKAVGFLEEAVKK